MEARVRLGRVAREIESCIAAAGLPAGYADLLRTAVAVDDKVLSPNPSSCWPLLTLAAYQAASRGPWEPAIPAAAAAELLIAGFDLLDDLEDGDPNPVVEACGPAQALNVLAGLLMLAQGALLRLNERGVPADAVLAAQSELARSAAIAGGGQYLDLLSESGSILSEEEALDVTARKAASLVSCVCRIGARLGTDDPAFVDQIGRFGWHIGMAGQLRNDLRDVSPGRAGKSDLRRAKQTLPVVAAPAFGLDVDWTSRTSGDDESIRQALARSGTLHYTWVVAETHRENARVLLAKLGSDRRPEYFASLLELA